MHSSNLQHNCLPATYKDITLALPIIINIIYRLYKISGTCLWKYNNPASKAWSHYKTFNTTYM